MAGIQDPPNVKMDIKFSDFCLEFEGCLNGDIWKFGNTVGVILITIEILFWSGLSYYLGKKILKRYKPKANLG